MTYSDSLLFTTKPLCDVLHAQFDSARKEIDAIPMNGFLANSDHLIAKSIYRKMEIRPLQIDQKRVTRTEVNKAPLKKEDDEEKMPISAVILEVAVPYTGETGLWHLRPNTFLLKPLHGKIVPSESEDQAGTLYFTIEPPPSEIQGDWVHQEIENYLGMIEKHLGWIKRDLDAHQPQLRDEINRQIKQRRERLGQIQRV